MTYVEGNPVVGFTLDLDGDPAAIEAVIAAAMKELGKQYERAERESDLDTLLRGGIVPRPLYRLPARRPAEGILQLRTTA